jgi:hypothetical protein
MPELTKYHTFNTVIIGTGVALRWRGDTGASPFPPVALRNDGYCWRSQGVDRNQRKD